MWIAAFSSRHFGILDVPHLSKAIRVRHSIKRTAVQNSPGLRLVYATPYYISRPLKAPELTTWLANAT